MVDNENSYFMTSRCFRENYSTEQNTVINMYIWNKRTWGLKPMFTRSLELMKMSFLMDTLMDRVDVQIILPIKVSATIDTMLITVTFYVNTP